MVPLLLMQTVDFTVTGLHQLLQESGKRAKRWRSKIYSSLSLSLSLSLSIFLSQCTYRLLEWRINSFYPLNYIPPLIFLDFSFFLLYTHHFDLSVVTSNVASKSVADHGNHDERLNWPTVIFLLFLYYNCNSYHHHHHWSYRRWCQSLISFFK